MFNPKFAVNLLLIILVVFIYSNCLVHKVHASSNNKVWQWRYGDVPVKVAEIPNVVAITGGKNFEIALKSDGTLWARGENQLGQLGIGTFQSTFDVPKQVVGKDSEGYLTGVKAIASSGRISVALKYDGTIWTWGENLGLTGSSTNAYNSTPVQVYELEGDIFKNAKEVAVDEDHVLILKHDGSVFEWGLGFDGYRKAPCVSTCYDGYPKQIADSNGINALSGVKAISAGHYHSLVIKDDGSVWGWGSTYDGQLGLNNKNESFKRLPSKIDGLNNIIKISSKETYNLALDDKGDVYEWGDIIPIPAKRPHLGKVIQIAASYYSGGEGLVIDTNGRLLHWPRRALNSFPSIVNNSSTILVSGSVYPYHNIYVTGNSTIPSELNQVDYKQTDPRWGGALLGNSSDCGNMYSFGCAVTSVADVFYSYGKTQIGSALLDPGILNAWLANNNGFSSCAIYWSAASAAVDIGAPILKFRNGKTDWSEGAAAIDNALAQGNLAIVGVYTRFGTHFLVVDKKLADVSGKPDYRIVDPAMYPFIANNPGNSGKALSEVYGGFDKVFETIIYKKISSPQNTLTVRVHSPVELLITDPLGKQTGYNEEFHSIIENIPDSAYGIDAGIAPVDGSGYSYGETKYFQQINPFEGQYTIQLVGTGNGSYKLDFAKTDEQRRTNSQVLEGYTMKGITETYLFSYTNNATEFPSIVRVVTFPIMRADLEGLNLQDQLSNKGIYASLKALIDSAEKESLMENIRDNRVIKVKLEAIQNELTAHRGKLITEKAYTLLYTDTEELLKSFQ